MHGDGGGGSGGRAGGDPLAETGVLARAAHELAWLRFVVPRQAVQVAARHLPLSRLRDALPRGVTARLRLGLYPARVATESEDARAGRCARSHPAWGDPAALDPARPLRFEGPPRASILLVTYGNLSLTRLCLASLQRTRNATPFEIIAVDNASPDESAAHLRALEREGLLPLRLVENTANRGFAAANNQAARLARGELLVLLNNDTVVTDGWLDALAAHLSRQPALGLVGPSTNSCGHPAVEVPASYRDLPAMAELAAARAVEHAGQNDEVSMMPLFCAAIPRALYHEVGGLDEGYGRGMFEDDDLAEAVRARGRRVACARDAFVHHYGGAAFSRLPQVEYLRLFFDNRRRFEKKWGVPWRER